MNQTFLIITGVVSLVSSVLIGSLVLFSGLKFFDRFNQKIDKFQEIKKDNKAVALMCASYLVAFGITMEGALHSLLQSFNRIMVQVGDGFGNALNNGLMLSAQFFIAVCLSAFGLWLGGKFFAILTHDLDEMEEIKNGNVSVAILFSSVLITLSFIIRTGIIKLIKTLEVHPEVMSESIKYFG